MKFKIFPVLALASFSLAIAPITLSQSIPNSGAQNSGAQTFFTGETPTLVKVGTPTSNVQWPNPSYYFTFNLPQNSGQSLSKVTIQPQENVETIKFNLSNTQAFVGVQNQEGQPLKINVTQDATDQTITINFDSPIPPGTTFTIRLKAVRNPITEGVYVFRVFAFPSGDNSTGLNLGVGQINFYSRF